MNHVSAEQAPSVFARDTAYALLGRAVNLPAADLPQWRKDTAALLEQLEGGRLGRHHRQLNGGTPTADLLEVTRSARIRVLCVTYARSQEPGQAPVSPQWDTDAVAILGILGKF